MSFSANDGGATGKTAVIVVTGAWLLSVVFVYGGSPD
jgi:hypothetical protein